MDAIRGLFDSIVELFTPISRAHLTDFQKRKLMHEFNTFYDKNKDGSIQWKDFEIARKDICQLSGWKDDSPKYKKTQELFIELWSNLRVSGDKDADDEITREEWLNMWTTIYRAKLMYERDKAKARDNQDAGDDVEQTITDQENSYIPTWFNKYIQYKFNLYDRAGDGILDMEEFEYTLSHFNISSKDCKNAFTLMSEAGRKIVDIGYFRRLALDYYLSTDPSALGNFINGQLNYD